MFESLEDELDRDIGAFLEERDYVVFQLDEQGQPDLHHTSNQNLFAVPMEKREELLFPEDSTQWA